MPDNPILLAIRRASRDAITGNRAFVKFDPETLPPLDEGNKAAIQEFFARDDG